MTLTALPTDPEITPALVRQHGLTDDEVARVHDLLGRAPTWPELGIYSVMWSEHCSYENSIRLLKMLPRDGAAVLAGLARTHSS